MSKTAGISLEIETAYPGHLGSKLLCLWIIHYWLLLLFSLTLIYMYPQRVMKCIN